MNVSPISVSPRIILAVLIAGAAAAATPDYATLISHRGESVDAPENTLPAYKTAVERGFGFECDIYLSADKRVFTFHDNNLKRTSGGKLDKKCSEANWETEISKLDVGAWGKWKGSKFVGTRPALLEEVLELARDGRWIYVEVKPGPEIVPYVKEIFAKQKMATPRNTLFISFNKQSCRALKEQMPEYKVLWLTGSWSREKGNGSDVAETVIAGGRDAHADGVDIAFSAKQHDAAFVKKVTDAGLEFHVWTLDRLEDTLAAFAVGARTVTTNCAKKQRDEYKAGNGALAELAWTLNSTLLGLE